MRLMGLTEEDIAKELEESEPDTFEVWPEHVKALNLFKAIGHQWRVPPLGGTPLGLEYPAVEAALKLMFPKKQRRQLFMQLQQIEQGAIKAWGKK